MSLSVASPAQCCTWLEHRVPRRGEQATRAIAVEGRVPMPEDWADTLCFLKDQLSPEARQGPGAISCFDGRPRPDRSRISDQLNAQGIPCYSLDTEVTEKMDVTTDVGILIFLRMLIRLAEKSLLWFAPPCGSFTGFVSKHSHGRSPTEPEGIVGPWTRWGSNCADWTAKAVRAAASKGNHVKLSKRS